MKKRRSYSDYDGEKYFIDVSHEADKSLTWSFDFKVYFNDKNMLKKLEDYEEKVGVIKIYKLFTKESIDENSGGWNYAVTGSVNCLTPFQRRSVVNLLAKVLLK